MRRRLANTTLRGLTWSGGVLVLFAIAGTPAQAKPQHLRAVADYYGPFFPAALRGCGTCHQAGAGAAATSLESFPHNAFGDRLRKVGDELRAAGKRADLPSRLKAIAEEDSDRDGASNLTEILAGTRPGDAKERPAAARSKELAQLRRRFDGYLAAYRWTPFEPVRRPEVPKVKRTAWVRNPIDAFVEAEREKHGLVPRPTAAREVLLRRIYLDLTGLSPTPEERRAFLADRSPNAYEKVVDRLLTSPQYGERWGRHWMDVWRYSDWAGWGEQVRDSQRHIWHWRDWIVDSLNSDKGYDRMVQEMVAGDELAPLDPDALRGTGFLVRNFKLLSREKWLEDTVDHTAQAFLGITMGCARCHDHMYDPLTQKEYYRFRAIFEPHQVRTDRVAGVLDIKNDGLPHVFDKDPDVPTYLYIRGDERQPVKEDPLTPGVPESLGGKFTVQPVTLPLLARQPDKQPQVIETLRADAARLVEERRRALGTCKSEEETSFAQLQLAQAEAAQAALEAVLTVEKIEDTAGKGSEAWKRAAAETVQRQRALAVADARLKQVETTRAVAAAKPAEKAKAEEAARAAANALAQAEAAEKQPVGTDYKPRVTETFPERSTGRRLALARWITAPENPLAARVAVNQVWLRHFGQGLVPSVADFGRNGTGPTNPALLDWLAAEFMSGSGQSGTGALPHSNGAVSPAPNTEHPTPAAPWSLKALHRLIVTSNTYKMASTPDPVGLARDPDNKYLWRMSYRRMDAEVVRDNVLWVAGQLDLKRGGADIDENEGLRVKRRTIYFRHAAEKQMVFTDLFDGPSVTECYMRKQTVIPQQALAMANSVLALDQSRLLARQVDKTAGTDSRAFAAAAYERVLARTATPVELKECVQFLAEQAKLLGTLPPSKAAEGKSTTLPAADPVLRARENLILVLLNHNDFVTIR